MWDFTVRDWRVATTCDIENLSEGEQTAVLPQRKVRKLQYEDTKIGEAYFSAIAFIVFTLQEIKQGIYLLGHPVWYGMVCYTILLFI
jgi:urease accessory protein UreF